MDGFAYLPGDEAESTAPLAHYLPPGVAGMATGFLTTHSRPGDWVLDPFGVSPGSDLEMARLGFRVLVAANNPVLRFMLEVQAAQPSLSALRLALSDLAATRKGEERLETHLQSLYLTECTRCHQQVPAEAFIWQREPRILVGRILHCSCGEEGEYPSTPADQQRAATLAELDGMHRSRLLERVAAPDDPQRLQVAEALECYPPRAVYALSTLINKLDGMGLPAASLRLAQALLLTACDEACSLWPQSGGRPRPKILTIPPSFLEKNVWNSLERGVESWAGSGQRLEIVNWPATPPETGGLCLFEGTLRDLAPHLRDRSPATVVTILPRPNQAFWTLSALWAGWLWGRQTSAMFKSVLRRRRFDWTWHAGALNAAFSELFELLPLNASVFTLLPEPEPSFLSAAILAAAGAGFHLAGLALRTRHDPLQLLWQRSAFNLAVKDNIPLEMETARQAMISFLEERGEPAPYLHLHAAGLEALAGDLSRRSRKDRGSDWLPGTLSQVNALLQEALEGQEFTHLSESANPESGMWDLKHRPPGSESLPDRVEVWMVGKLIKDPGLPPGDLESALNQEFPGLQTPSRGMMRAVLDSYARETGTGLTLRDEDAPALRRQDLEAATQALSELASHLGYNLQRLEGPPRQVQWLDSGVPAYTFLLLASALAGRSLQQSPPSEGRALLVIPGGRASLLAYKMERDEDLRRRMGTWQVVKFRTLRKLALSTHLDRAGLEKEISSDPIEPPEQMKLF